MYYSSNSTDKFMTVPLSVQIFSYVGAAIVFLVCLASWLVAQPLSQAELYELYNNSPLLVNLYHALAPLGGLYEGIPYLVHASYPFLFFIILGASLLVIAMIFGPAFKEVLELLGEKLSYGGSQGKIEANRIYPDNAKRHMAEMTFGVVAFLGTSLLVGWYQSPEGHAAAVAAHLDTAISTYGQHAYTFMFLIAPAWGTRILIHWSPVIAAGWVIARTGHPARGLIERTAARKRPDRAVLQELKDVLVAQDFDDARAARLFNELSPGRQQLWSARYLKRAKEAKRLRALVVAQTKAIEEDTSLAHGTLGLERARHARYEQ